MSPAETKLISSLALNSEDVIREARRWIGTPYAHWARERGVRTDCIGLIIGVGRNLAIGDYRKKDYAKKPDPVKMGRELFKYLDPVVLSDMRAGHITWLQLGRTPCHTAIVGEHPDGHGLTLIHAYEAAGKVVEHRLDAAWRARIYRVFAYRGVVV